MKRKIVCFFALLALITGLAWYNHQYHSYFYPFVTASSGLSYKAIGVGNGRKAQDGEWVALSLVMKAASKNGGKGGEGDHKEKILMNSFDEPQPFLLPFGEALKNKRIAEMIGMVQEKQRMIFKCSSEYYVGEENAEHLKQILKAFNLKKEDELVVDIKLDKIMTNEERIQMIEARRATQLAKDKQLITDHLTAHHIQACSTDSGLFYIIDQPSQSTPVVKNKTIQVNYTGRLLNGTIFDTSLQEIAKANNIYHPQREYKPLEFQVGAGHVIAGWDEGLLLLKKHEKARFFIPSTLAYGEEAVGKLIPANAILLFEVEVVDLF